MECQRERGASSALPPHFFLHVWWARRPLIASRAAVLGSLLPAWASDWPDELHKQFPSKEKYHKWFRELLGITGDPVASWNRIQEVKKSGSNERVGYPGPRAFTVNPTSDQIETIQKLFELTWGERIPSVLDPTAGGGSIPLESLRFGINTLANELNPVAVSILKATLEYPVLLGTSFYSLLETKIGEWSGRVKASVTKFYPPNTDESVFAYIYVRTVKCPHSGKTMPLNPNWWLRRGDQPVAIKFTASKDSEQGKYVIQEGKKIDFDPTVGTVKRGKGVSPWTDDIVTGDYIKAEAQAGRMGAELYAVAVKTSSGVKFRLPNISDNNTIVESAQYIEDVISNRLPETEIPMGSKTIELLRYGMGKWTERFLPRQLIILYFSLLHLQEIEQEMEEDGYHNDEIDAILLFLSLCISKVANFNSMGSRWATNRIGNVGHFDTHAYSFKWNFSEIPMHDRVTGFDWAVNQVLDAYKGILQLFYGKLTNPVQRPDSKIEILHGDGSALEMQDESIHSIVFDPPYYDNVQFAELADFFYIWMKEAIGHRFPSQFTSTLTEKDLETVMNPARFIEIDKKRAKQMAKDDYERKMTKLFTEAYRILRPEGVMTIMFNHKKVDAWDTLTKSIIASGFVVVSTWPIHTESVHSIHQANKAASASTILLTCSKRQKAVAGDVGPTFRDGVLWEDIQEELKETVRRSIRRFRFGDTEEGEEEDCGCEEGRHDKIERMDKTGEDKKNGNGNGSITAIDGVDLFIAVFGPALSVISEKWPVYMSTLDEKTHKAKLLSPEMALDLAREVIVDTRLEELFGKEKVKADEFSEWYIIGWSIFKAREFPFDEANKLARTLKVEVKDLAREDLVEKKGSRVILLPPTERLKEKKKTPYDLPLEHLIDLVQALMAAALVDQTTGITKLMKEVEKQQKEDEEARFSEANLKRYLQALIYSIPRLRNQDGTFELEEAEALDLLAVHFQLDLPEDPPLMEEMNQEELDLDEKGDSDNSEDQEDSEEADNENEGT